MSCRMEVLYSKLAIAFSLSTRVKCTRNEEFLQAEDRRGEWKTKVGLAIPEMERKPSRVDAGVGRIRPRMNRKELGMARTTSLGLIGTEMRAPEMEPAWLSKVFQFAKL